MNIIGAIAGALGITSGCSNSESNYKTEQKVLADKVFIAGNQHLDALIHQKKLRGIFLKELPPDGKVSKDEFVAATIHFLSGWSFTDSLEGLRSEHRTLLPSTPDGVQNQIAELSIQRTFIAATSLSNGGVPVPIIDEILQHYNTVLADSLFSNKPEEFKRYGDLFLKRYAQYNRALSGKGTIPFNVGPGFSGNEFVSVGNEFAGVLLPGATESDIKGLGLKFGLMTSHDARTCREIFSRYQINK